MNQSITINSTEEFGFILTHWGIISIIMYTISLIVVCFALIEKTTILRKILNIIIITSIPLIGCIVYTMMKIWKNKVTTSDNSNTG